MVKKAFSVIVAVVMLLCLSTFFACDDNTPPPSKSASVLTDLARPIKNEVVGKRQNCVWDMHLFKGKLYVGTGDYTANSGQTEILAYDLSKKTWEGVWTAPSHAITRFVEINSKLVALGTDPINDWTFGEYYTLDQTEFFTNRKLPGGIHNFDMTVYDGKIFAGLGVQHPDSPIVVSENGGSSFTRITLLKNENPLDFSNYDTARVYEFIQFNGKLYAVLVVGDNERTELYEYIGGKYFVYHDDWTEKITFAQAGENMLCGKVLYNGALYFSSGVLYKTTDLTTITSESTLSQGAVTDLLVANNSLFVLRVQKLVGGGYLNTIWKSDGDTFTDVYSFEYGVPAICMEYYDGYFYLGMGDKLNNNPLNGKVLSVKYS